MIVSRTRSTTNVALASDAVTASRRGEAFASAGTLAPIPFTGVGASQPSDGTVI